MHGNHPTSLHNLHSADKALSPGRAFAAVQLKVLLAYLICNYDFRTPTGEGRPPSEFFSFSCLPDFKARLLFRKRAGAGKSFFNKKAA
jgi:hypothetical protein